MTTIRHADSSPAVKKTSKSHSKKNDPNAVHDVYTENKLDPAYDENLGDDIAFDYEGKSGDPGDKPEKKKK
jgi:hypothetical protein